MNDNVNQPGAQQPSIPIDFNYIIARVQAVLFDPRGVWQSIRAENLNVKDMYVKYLLPLAGAAAICQYLGMVFSGVWPIFGGLIYAIISFAMSMAGLFVGAVIIQALAPKFDASVSMPGALQLLGFSMTAVYVTGLFSIVPILGLLVILGALYSLYTLYQGFAPVTGVPQDKRGPFFGISLVAILVAMIVMSWLASFAQPRIQAVDFSELRQQLEQLTPPVR